MLVNLTRFRLERDWDKKIWRSNSDANQNHNFTLRHGHDKSTNNWPHWGSWCGLQIERD